MSIEISGRKVAVTGPAGHVGANLVPMLLGHGCTVNALVRKNAAAIEGLDVDRHQGDLMDKASLLRAFEKCDTVFHLASVISLARWRDDPMREINVEGTRNVVEACRECGVRRLIHFSSIHSFSPYPLHEVVDEERELCGEGSLPYDLSKADADRIVLQAREDGLDTVFLAPVGILGPNDHILSPMGRTLLGLMKGHLPLIPKSGYNWVDVRDVAQAAIAAATHENPSPRYILSGQYHRIHEFAPILRELSGRSVRVFTIPMWMAYLGVPFTVPLRPFFAGLEGYKLAALHTLERHQKVSNEKAKAELGFEPRDIEETLRDTVEWFKECGRLS